MTFPPVPVSGIPHIFASLSDSDKSKCAALLNSLAPPTAPSRPLSFSETLELIRLFVMRNDKDDAVRGVLCGVYWLPDSIAVHIRQLSRLLSRSKSSINGSLRQLGFVVKLGRAASGRILTAVLPILNGRTAELRKWTIRKNTPGLPQMPVRQFFEVNLAGLAPGQWEMGDGRGDEQGEGFGCDRNGGEIRGSSDGLVEVGSNGQRGERFVGMAVAEGGE
jgi:hypothetical protein